MRLAVCTLLFALVAAFHTVIPTQAEAASALFRVKRSWVGAGPNTPSGEQTTYISTDFHPRMKGPSKAPPAQAYVPRTMSGDHFFTIRSKVIKDYTRTRACPTFMDCRPGYPVSSTVLSYHNVKGSFRPNNPYGAMTTTTVVFPTTMGNPSPPIATGEPTSPTTEFSGRYDFLREGSIMITPGANRFGGTMKFFFGPNQMYYQRFTLSTSYISISSGFTLRATTTPHASFVGSQRVGRVLYAPRYTLSGYYPITTGTPYSPRDPYVKRIQYITTAAPWTTGSVVIEAHSFQSVEMSVNLSGYDNRTPNGLSGVISLVRPRLVHSYVVPHDPNLPIMKARSFAEIWQMDIHFMPEPTGVAMLVAGFATLACLYRLHSR